MDDFPSTMASASVSVTSLACVTATVLNAFVASVSATFAVFAVANVAVLPTVSAPDCVTLPLAVTVRSLPTDDFPSTMASASRSVTSRACVTATVLNAFVASVSTTFAVFAVAIVAVLPTVSAPDCVTLPVAVTVRVVTYGRLSEHDGVSVSERYIFSLRNRNVVLNAFVASVSTTFAVFAVANVAVLPTVSAPDCVTLPLAVTA